MSYAFLALISLSCWLAGTPSDSCMRGETPPQNKPAVAAAINRAPVRSGDSVDVILSADAALVWDIDSGVILYGKNEAKERPIASITKLLSALVIRDELSLSQTVEIPPDVLKAQRQGADIELPTGEHTTVRDLLGASMIASANDAIVSLAVAVSGSEDEFVQKANDYASTHNMSHTVASNSTGLSGGTQHSTALDVKEMLTRAYKDPVLREMLAQPDGTLETYEGTKRNYKSTNKLLKTYVPIIAAKTGYTYEAGENLAIITAGAQGQKIGAVILGSTARFQDMKVLVEWIWRNWTWEK